MIHHEDGSISEIPAIKTHPKMENGMLSLTELSNDGRKQMIDVLSNYIDDDKEEA